MNADRPVSDSERLTRRGDRIEEIRELLGFDICEASRSDSRLEYDELSTIVRELSNTDTEQ